MANPSSIACGVDSPWIDFTKIETPPTGGFLFACWMKTLPVMGDPPFNHGNQNGMRIFGTCTNPYYTWELWGVGNASFAAWNEDPPMWFTGLNCNTMLGTYKNYGAVGGDGGDFTYYQSAATELTVAQVQDWHWVAWWVKVGTDRFTLVQWVKVGVGDTEVRRASSVILFSTLRANMVSTYGWTPAEANAWVPVDVGVTQCANDIGYYTRISVCQSSTEPTQEQLDALYEAQTPPGGILWGNYLFRWTGGAADISDSSGNGHNMALWDAGSVLYEGVPGPMADASSEDYTAFFASCF
jgi:hypothetical protein